MITETLESDTDDKMKSEHHSVSLIDFDTIEKGEGVTVRDRDSGKQERVSENELVDFLKARL
jgi:glycyl-tRNA synthetase (class II)